MVEKRLLLFRIFSASLSKGSTFVSDSFLICEFNSDIQSGEKDNLKFFFYFIFQDGKGNRYLDLGTYLLKIEPTTAKRSAEDELPQQNMPKKKKIVKSPVKEEDLNGNDGRRTLDSSKLRSCPYCDKGQLISKCPSSKKPPENFPEFLP